MPACTECHRAKVKCDQGRPCSRCVRLGLDCVERISRQGRGPKKRRRKQPPGALMATEGQQEEPDSLHPNSEDGRIVSAMTEFGQFHYGVRYLIHSWTSFAFARRSFSLLSRASRLAAKCGVPMDEIYCLERRDVLDPILYKYPTNTTHDMKKKPQLPLDSKELPPALLQVLDAENPSSRQNRLLMVREARNGQSRYLVTDEFQQQIASLWLLEQTWKANTIPVVQIFLEGPEDFDKFNKSIRYSLSRYTHPNKKPECVRINAVRVKQQQQQDNNISSSIRIMDLLYAFEIVNLEHSFYIVELVDSTAVHSSGSSTSGETIAKTHQSTTTTTAAATTTTTADPLQMFGNLVPLEEMDSDFEAFLELLND